MKDEYDFSQSVKNPYFDKLQQPVTIQIEGEIIDYFKKLAQETGIPYQNLINLYLKDCVLSKRKISLEWISSS